MRKRPTAEDRELAEIFRKMRVGNYSIEVEPRDEGLRFFGLARLKPEGGTEIRFDNKTIYITPVEK